jgi:CubicO group peptidase (beta-lactamase class C family)
MTPLGDDVRRNHLLSLSLLAAWALASVAYTAPVARLTPSDISGINHKMHALVDSSQAAGIVTLIVQDGKRLDLDAYGSGDTGQRKPMRQDSIGAVASMTKPITGVAMMMLYEQGKWSLEDPVEKYVPALKNLKFMDEAGHLVPARHPPTMRELMSHSAGFTYGVFADTAVDRLVRAAQLTDPNSSLPGMIGKLSQLPLKHQPGTAWEYSVSVDVQGYIVEVISGMPYAQFVEQKILRPLKMKDSGFAVTGKARERLALPHAPDSAGKLVPSLPPGGRDAIAMTTPRLPSPGGSLYSTVSDYARFCQMIVNGGELEGVRLLKPQTVGLMHRNALPPGVFVSMAGPGTTFGLDFAIAGDPSSTKEPWPAGTYYWSGIYGTYFWIDPVNHLVVVGMIQRTWVPGTDAAGSLVARNTAGEAIYTALNAHHR